MSDGAYIVVAVDEDTFPNVNGNDGPRLIVPTISNPAFVRNFNRFWPW